MSAAVGVDLLRATLEAREEPGVAELLEALRTVARDAGVDEWTSELTPLKRRVYRLHLNESRAHSVILKRSEPAIAQLNRLVAERWLPALRLGDHCAALLATAADRQGRWYWQIYEDLGVDTLERQSDRLRVGATTDLIAELHGRGAGHALLPEVRQYGKDLGLAFFAGNVGDAIRGLERLGGEETPAELRSLGDRLLRRMYPLAVDMPNRAQVLKDAGGPDTILHGDLWRHNAFATVAAGAVFSLPFYLAEIAAGGTMVISPKTVVAIAYLAVFPSVVAYICWNRAVPIVGPNVAGFFNPIIPVFGTLFAVILLGERLHLYHLAGFALVLGGVVLTSKR